MSSPAPAPTGARPPRAHRPLGRGLTVFLVVDVVLVVVLVVLAAMALAGRDAGDPTPQVSPSGSPQAEQSPEESAPESDGEQRELQSFILPSGNIWCVMDEESATCSIESFTYDRPEKPESCEGQVGQVLRVSAEAETSLPCVEGKVEAPEGLEVLEYGQSSSVGDMTCHASERGAFCRHEPSQAGFSLARAGYRLF